MDVDTAVQLVRELGPAGTVAAALAVAILYSAKTLRTLLGNHLGEVLDLLRDIKKQTHLSRTRLEDVWKEVREMNRRNQ